MRIGRFLTFFILYGVYADPAEVYVATTNESLPWYVRGIHYFTSNADGRVYLKTSLTQKQYKFFAKVHGDSYDVNTRVYVQVPPATSTCNPQNVGKYVLFFFGKCANSYIFDCDTYTEYATFSDSIYPPMPRQLKYEEADGIRRTQISNVVLPLCAVNYTDRRGQVMIVTTTFSMGYSVAIDGDYIASTEEYKHSFIILTVCCFVAFGVLVIFPMAVFSHVGYMIVKEWWIKRQKAKLFPTKVRANDPTNVAQTKKLKTPSAKTPKTPKRTVTPKTGKTPKKKSMSSRKKKTKTSVKKKLKQP